MRTNLRMLRETTGLTQTALAVRAGVSRQLVGAVEAGRHLPRVDAALALAAALAVNVDDLFVADTRAVDIVSGTPPRDGTLVRAALVGERIVTAAARIGPDGWDVADGVVEAGEFSPFDRTRQGPVLAGCEPGLELVERLLREGGIGAVTVGASSASARAALAAGRVHGAVVHGAGVLPAHEDAVCVHIARWRVGLAAGKDATPGWSGDALAGRLAVVQREEGAGVQHAFENALEVAGPVAGPRVGSHLEAARRAVLTGLPAVTIEPAALAVGATFHPLEVHQAQLLIAIDWIEEASVAAALDVLASRRFQDRLAAIGGYDLDGCGTRAA